MVFGTTYVAENEECAKKVAFNKDVQARVCVTLKGDKYDPRGTLHGGFAGKNNQLARVAAYMNSEGERAKMRDSLIKL